MEKTNGKRNKSAGSNFEREVVNKLKTIGFPNVGTTRNNSRSRDAQKIDVMNVDEGKFGRLRYNIQCKTLSKPAPYGKLLDELPQDGEEINIVIHKQTKKSESGRFMARGTYAIMMVDDFYDLIAEIEQLKNKLYEASRT